ncbi:MAG TPA: hypothetical protein VML55_25995 [Planctomycetaceae bacterium]|nr:hypothetical protein [Planctomycetaceae bacterium]
MVTCIPATILATVLIAALVQAEERFQNFDRDPGWEGHNNRAAAPVPQAVRQDFGYSRTRHCGGDPPGELGGFLTPAAEPAWYAKRVGRAAPAGPRENDGPGGLSCGLGAAGGHSPPYAEGALKPLTFDDRLTASGKLACTGRQFHVLVGFFNSGTVNEWRTPNSIVLRLYGRGDVFYAYVEYATSRWRAGGDSPGGFATIDDPDTGRQQLRGFASNGTVHTWSLTYDPAGNDGGGSITATIDDQTAVCHLDAGHRQDGARFDRCGLLSIPKHFDTPGEVWLDDVTINGETERFDRDPGPGWDARDNRRTYTTHSVRPRFDFGFSPTHFAGGERPGELGGEIFRGDNRHADRMAYYGDRLEPLTLERPLRASGKLALRRAVSDSTVLIGFFHSRDSVAVSDSQASGFPMNFLGAAIEGPSRDGFLFYPAYRLPDGAEGYARSPEPPHLLPDGESHAWSLDYEPQANDGAGRLTVMLDDHRTVLDFAAGDRLAPARFDRFGIVTTWIDGNSQHVYFDDLRYTFRQAERRARDAGRE